jgi:CO/xanthine dehydrogenase Mo-binding subunit
VTNTGKHRQREGTLIGAGEAATPPVAAALANAIFDTPERTVHGRAGEGDL